MSLLVGQLNSEAWLEFSCWFHNGVALSPDSIEEIELLSLSMVGFIFKTFYPEYLWSMPNLLARVCFPKFSVAKREANYDTILKMNHCCRRNPEMGDKIIDAYPSPGQITKSCPQTLLRCFVRLSKPHTIKAEVRHFWNKWADTTSCGRGLGILMLSTRFMAREMRQTRHSLSAAASASEANHEQEDPKDIAARLRQVGCPHPFQLFCQNEIQRRKVRGDWDSACVEITTEYDGGKVVRRRGEAGQQFLAEMSAAWADAKTQPEGHRIQEEARANAAKRSQLKTKLAAIKLATAHADEISPEVLQCELGIGSRKVPITSQAYRHLETLFPSGNWLPKFKELHNTIPAQPKVAGRAAPLSCAEVGFCLEDCKATDAACINGPCIPCTVLADVSFADV
jgi:hypothetical protein